MQHIHGPNCGCKDYLGVENANDLYGSIDLDKVRCLNQKSGKSGKQVFKESERRFDKQQFITSDCDGELLLIIPFLAQVKIRSICVISKNFEAAPNSLKLYVNNENVNFSITQTNAVQEFMLSANLEGSQHNAVNPHKFSRVHKLICFIKGAAQEIAVSYIQIKGESTNIKRQAVQAVYQLKPAAQKSDLKDLAKNAFQMG